MTTNEMKLAELEEKAKNALSSIMAGFDGEFCCPWLRWRKDLLFEENCDGVLLMQDWGNESQSLEDAIKEIKQAASIKDKTLNNLFQSKWQTPIWGEKPTWLVTNAVWGLRKPKDNHEMADKCGYLGDAVHAQAFPIWSQILGSLVDKNQNLQVVFAGSWARFDEPAKNCKGLKIFLSHWKQWTEKRPERPKFFDAIDEKFLNKIGDKATAHFYSHPSIWKKQNCWDGPP
jgi:hypothetical protein